MSQSEVERFVESVKSDEALRSELSSLASGVASIVEFAKSKGYDVTAEDVGSHMRAQLGGELSDSDLEALAGGAGTAPPTSALASAVVGQTVQSAWVEAVIGTQAQAVTVVVATT